MCAAESISRPSHAPIHPDSAGLRSWSFHIRKWSRRGARAPRKIGEDPLRLLPPSAAGLPGCHWGGTILVRFSTPGPSIHTYSTPQPLPPYAIIAGTILALSLSLSPYNPAGGCQCRASVSSFCTCQSRVTQSIKLVRVLLGPANSTNRHRCLPFLNSIPTLMSCINQCIHRCMQRPPIIPIL